MDYMRINMEEISPDKWRLIVRSAVQLAIAGDSHARKFCENQAGLAHSAQLHAALEARAHDQISNFLVARKQLQAHAVNVALASDDPRAIQAAIGSISDQDAGQQRTRLEVVIKSRERTDG